MDEFKIMKLIFKKLFFTKIVLCTYVLISITSMISLVIVTKL